MVCVLGRAEGCERGRERAAVACAERPGKARAATAVKAPVSVTLPATSQRFARPSDRSAASRVWVVWAFTDNQGADSG